MADNIDVTPGAGKTVAADEIAGVLHQRVKLSLGADGVNDGDVSSSNPMPITGALTVTDTDNAASGTISTQNLNPNSGVATANSSVEITLGAGQNTIAIQTVGTYTGALTLQGTVDGTNWVSFAGTPILNVNTGLWLATITSALQSLFFAKVSGVAKIRISANAAVTGSAVVSIGASTGDSFQGALGVLTTVTTVITVTTLTNITNWGNIVDNAAFTDGTTRLSMNGYIFDEVAGTALTENDGAAARIDSKRAQVFTQEDATTRGQRQAINSNGAASMTLSPFATTTNANVAGSASSVTLAASNTARKELTITNDSASATLYVKEGTTASLTDYKFIVPPMEYYKTNNYNGRVDGIWSAAVGTARVAES